jgi:hypothetical protein
MELSCWWQITDKGRSGYDSVTCAREGPGLRHRGFVFAGLFLQKRNGPAISLPHGFVFLNVRRRKLPFHERESSFLSKE